VSTLKEVFKSFEITKASVYDIHYLKNIKQELENCIIIGMKGYLSADYQLDLFEIRNVKLEVPIRKNQKNTSHKVIFSKNQEREL